MSMGIGQAEVWNAVPELSCMRNVAAGFNRL